MSDGKTYYHFYPSFQWPRSAAIEREPVGKRPKIRLYLKYKAGMDGPVTTLYVNGEQYGPGDIIGFDDGFIVKRDPQPNVGTFEPNYFPSVDFAVPDFPWRYTAQVADKEKNGYSLTPWITLIVLNMDEANNEIIDSGKPEKDLPAWIKVDKKNLPNLNEAWRWAHVQVTAGSEIKVDIPEFLKKKAGMRCVTIAVPSAFESTNKVSRLYCADVHVG